MLVTAEFRDNAMLAVFFLCLLGLSSWLQFGLLDSPDTEVVELDENALDYYAENFITTGLDEAGVQYQIIAGRLEHYPDGDRALLDNPHIIQYMLSKSPRHVFADSGWLYDNQTKVLLTGNVKVVQNQSDRRNNVVSSEKMLIHLKQKRNK